MSMKCRAFSLSKLGVQKTDARTAFYAGWDAALAHNAQNPSADAGEAVRTIEELLEALEEILGWETLCPIEVYEQAREAIAKARGEV